MQKQRKRATLEHDLEVATEINQTLRILLNEKQTEIDKLKAAIVWQKGRAQSLVPFEIYTKHNPKRRYSKNI